MTIAVENLPNNIEALKALFIEEMKKHETVLNRQQDLLKKQNESLDIAKHRIATLEELLRRWNNKEYGSSSEKWPSQGCLFNEAETEVAETEAAIKQVVNYERKRPKRRPLPEGLPRDIRTYKLEGDDLNCECGGTLKEFSEEISEQLDVIPAKIQVIRHVRKKYSCPCCRSNIKIAKMPLQPIPKSNASSGLLAYIATSKYADALPLHRQETIFGRLGIDMERNTLARWMISLGELLRPLYNLMQDDLLDAKVLMMDETPVQVLKGTGKKPSSANYMWVRCRSGPDKTIILFHYDPYRSAACAKGLLSGFSGHLVTDGYEAYGSVVRSRDDIIHCGCWDHARRKFFEAHEAQTKSSVKSLAEEGLNHIQKLYLIERSVKDSDDESRRIARNLYSRSVLDHLKKWLDQSIDSVPPKSLTGKAMSYLRDQWEKLNRFLEDGAIPISNARAENSIRPFVIGKKNWLFSDTRAGAESSSILYSIIETAKANGKEPYAYLKWVISEIPSITTVDQMMLLLPY